MHSDFSGQRAHETCYRIVACGCTWHGLRVPLMSHCFKYVRCCDPSPLSKDIARDSKYKPLHWVDTVLDKLDYQTQNCINQHRPRKHALDSVWGNHNRFVEDLLNDKAQKRGSRIFSKASCEFHPGARCNTLKLYKIIEPHTALRRLLLEWNTALHSICCFQRQA